MNEIEKINTLLKLIEKEPNYISKQKTCYRKFKVAEFYKNHTSEMNAKVFEPENLPI